MSARIATIIAAAALTALAALPSPASAQIDPDGGDIVIDNIGTTDIDNVNGVAVFVGNVNAVQGDTHIQTDRLELYFDKAAEGAQTAAPDLGSLTRAVAIGAVYYVTADQIATGDQAVYDVAADTVTMTGNAVVTQGCDVVSGGVVVMNLTTKNAQVQAPAGGRVRTVISNSDDAAAAPAAGCAP